MKSAKGKWFVTLGSATLLILITAHNVRAEENTEQEKPRYEKQGPYIEAAPTFTQLWGDSSDNGLGFHVAAGYEWEKFAIGGKWFNVSGYDYIGGLQAEGRLYFLELFGVPTERFRPYALAGVGFSLAGADAPDSAFDIDLGLQADVGVGAKYYLTKHFYVGAEAAYQPYIIERTYSTTCGLNGCMATDDPHNEYVHSINTALTMGFTF